MLIKDIVEEDFSNYKKPSMYIAFPFCSWKCCPETVEICQNYEICKQVNINVSEGFIVERYLNNPITKAIVLSGLEPFDSWVDVKNIVDCFRQFCKDDIVIYTGYYKEEIQEYLEQLRQYENIIIKYGRFIPNQKSHYDELLGVYLASDNQFSEIL